jgi:hypothetical protein
MGRTDNRTSYALPCCCATSPIQPCTHSRAICTPAWADLHGRGELGGGCKSCVRLDLHGRGELGGGCKSHARRKKVVPIVRLCTADFVRLILRLFTHFCDQTKPLTDCPAADSSGLGPTPGFPPLVVGRFRSSRFAGRFHAYCDASTGLFAGSWKPRLQPVTTVSSYGLGVHSVVSSPGGLQPVPLSPLPKSNPSPSPRPDHQDPDPTNPTPSSFSPTRPPW